MRTTSAAETRRLGSAIAACLDPGAVVVLSGELGSGKTTLAQGIAAELGVAEPVVSPTFAIVREYEGRVPLAHVDVYRLEHVQELYDFGFEELFDGTRVVLVEWGDLVAPVLPADRVVVRLQNDDDVDDTRMITVTAEGPRRASMTALLASVLDGLVQVVDPPGTG